MSLKQKPSADLIKPKLAPLNEGGSELLNKTVACLQEENEKLKIRLKTIETQATTALDEKSKLEKSLKDLQMIQGDQKTNANQDITELENKVAALKCQFEKTLNDSTANQKFLEENLVTTKHDLLKVQDQLSTAEKELEKKFQQTAAYRNMKEILTKKNEQIKDLRKKLSKIWKKCLASYCAGVKRRGFLIPYFIMLVVEGMPLLYLELAVGQRMRQGSIGAWKIISPYLCGVGVASVVVSFFLSMYYNVINAWAFWYLFHSFQLEELSNPKTWISAATQIFFSLGLGFGSLIAFASYNEPSNNCERHAIIVSLINSTTSIFASIVTFSIYGFKATFNYESCINK
ncbi:leucine zipper transcription factor-like protein 1 [Limosa lapponica baueri]|uniref:Leucine zipper transcription factor-like protein 1 n=1 Tax=Limosa lapponica baueri TaxID=1758121 RepID=A0A2I0TEN8_LIMLA|nr:leucine zipper transcription factor-like protein 1 [Limosa lapponica baueri]